MREGKALRWALLWASALNAMQVEASWATEGEPANLLREWGEGQAGLALALPHATAVGGE